MNRNNRFSATLKPIDSNEGSVLIYVLWILVVISVLAFQLTSASRVVTTSQSAMSSQLKKQMQIESAVQFAIFKIQGKQWENQSYSLNLNGQNIKIDIFNESGFISIYEVGSRSLKNTFESVNMNSETAEQIVESIENSDKRIKFNSFEELRRFSGINQADLELLIPLISVFHEDAVNPQYSPAAVLMLMPGIDKYRVQKLMESSDENEKLELKNGLIELLSVQGMELSEAPSNYFRVNVNLDGFIHRVFLRYDRRQAGYRVVLINSHEINAEL